MSKRRVVITGLGCVTALAESVDELFKGLCEGKSGLSAIESFDVTEYSSRIGGEIRRFDVGNYVDPREGKRMDRFTQFALAAAINAVKDSGLDFSKEDAWRAGSIIGTGIGGIGEIEAQHKRLLDKGPRKMSPFCVPRLMANAACGNIAIQYGLRGSNFAVSTACASATHAIGEAYLNIAHDRSDIIISGGSEAALTPVGLSSFCALKALSTMNDTPEKASRPFDRDRGGFVLAEGAGILVLEEYEHAKKRGAKIYAEMLGYGATDDGYHITAPLPNGEGAVKAMQLAMADAGVEKVDYINAHGTGTNLNDKAESHAIKATFGEETAYKTPVSSTKGALGHLLGATGAVELLICCRAITDSVIPPTANLDNVDPECDLKMDFVPKQARQAKINTAMSNSLGFGGHNASLIIGKV